MVSEQIFVLQLYINQRELTEGAGPLPLLKLPALCCWSVIETGCGVRAGGREREGVFSTYFPCAATPLPRLWC